MLASPASHVVFIACLSCSASTFARSEARAPEPEGRLEDTLTEAATPDTPRGEAAIPDEEAAERKLGFYFGMSLEKLSQLGASNGIGVILDRPTIAGGDVDIAGPQVDADFRSRWSLGFHLGFRLRKNHGSVEARWFQWDEQQDLFREAGEGEVFANTLASPDAGFDEDVGWSQAPFGPDGRVTGHEAGPLSEGSEGIDGPADGAEDLDFDSVAERIGFRTSNRIVGESKTDYQVFDLSHVRRLMEMRRFRLDGRFGLRAASVVQNTDLGYREVGSFAVYSDAEGGETTGTGEQRPGSRSGDCGSSTVQDGDGDGEDSVGSNEPDGDGFMDGNCNGIVDDRLESQETVSEDRIVANLKAHGLGVTAGVDGRFQISARWRLSGSIGMSVLAGKTELRYRETFTSERDRYLDFIDWDFNEDGKHDNYDLDFDGSCAAQNIPPELCRPNAADAFALPDIDPAARPYGARRGVRTRTRSGADESYASPRILNPRPMPPARGMNIDAFRGSGAGMVREGDPVPESERNRDTVIETTLLNDVSGEASGVQPMLDLGVGLEYQFSKFAHLDFGMRSTRWFGAGSFRSVANQVVDGAEVRADDGDFSLTGAYVTITVVPR